VFTGPDADALDRLWGYVRQFRRELRHGPHDRDRYPFAAVLLFLTDGPDTAEEEWLLPGGDSHFVGKPRLLRLAHEDAAATMAAIEEGRVAWIVLVWVPLMAGGQSAEAVQTWRRLVQREPDLARVRLLASLALVFSELTDSQDVWRTGLEGLAVNESTFIREWRQEGLQQGLQQGRQEGELEARRDSLLRILRRRFGPALPAEVEQRIGQQTDGPLLVTWLDQALAAPDLRSFVAGLGAES
jgi:hypothetical protein